MTQQHIENLNHFEDTLLTRAQIQGILHNQEALRIVLLRQISQNEITIVQELIRSNPEMTRNHAYLSAFLAKHRVDYRIAQDVVRYAAIILAAEVNMETALYADRETARNIARNATQNANWEAAQNAAFEAVHATAREAASRDQYFFGSPVLGNAWDAVTSAPMIAILEDTVSLAVRPSIAHALRMLALRDPIMIGCTTHELSELFTLQWLQQHNRTYFENAFNAARDVFIRSERNVFTPQQMRDMIGERINRAELNGNPFIRDLRQFLLRVEQIAVEPILPQ